MKELKYSHIRITGWAVIPQETLGDIMEYLAEKLPKEKLDLEPNSRFEDAKTAFAPQRIPNR